MLATKVYALDQNRTRDLSVRRPVLYPLSQTSFGWPGVLKNTYFIDFLQRGRERERELETSMREKHPSAASCTPPTGDVPTTKVHALDRNRTWDLYSPQANTLATEPNWLGLSGLFLSILLLDPI